MNRRDILDAVASEPGVERGDGQTWGEVAKEMRENGLPGDLSRIECDDCNRTVVTNAPDNVDRCVSCREDADTTTEQ